jgi:Zinc finger, C3HC4 type (RING finger)
MKKASGKGDNRRRGRQGGGKENAQNRSASTVGKGALKAQDTTTEYSRLDLIIENQLQRAVPPPDVATSLRTLFEDFKCPLCQDLIKSPIVALNMCGHSFCQSCIVHYGSGPKNWNCPGTLFDVGRHITEKPSYACRSLHQAHGCWSQK